MGTLSKFKLDIIFPHAYHMCIICVNVASVSSMIGSINYLVVYDDELTLSFLRCLIFLNYSKLKNPAIIYIAVEKRFVQLVSSLACITILSLHFIFVVN